MVSLQSLLNAPHQLASATAHPVPPAVKDFAADPAGRARPPTPRPAGTLDGWLHPDGGQPQGQAPVPHGNCTSCK